MDNIERTATEPGNLIIQDYNQFNSFEDKVHWDLLEEYELISKVKIDLFGGKVK